MNLVEKQAQVIGVLTAALLRIGRDDFRGNQPIHIDIATKAIADAQRIAAEPVDVSDLEYMQTCCAEAGVRLVVCIEDEGGLYECPGDGAADALRRQVEWSQQCMDPSQPKPEPVRMARWVRAQGVQS